MVAYPLLGLTASGLLPINITKLLHSCFVMLFQAFTAAPFTCLFQGGFPFNIFLRRWNACSIGLSSGDWLGQSKPFHFFSLMKSFVVLALLFLSHCLATWWSSSQLVWTHFSVSWQTEFYKNILPAATIIRYIINKDYWAYSRSSHESPSHAK